MVNVKKIIENFGTVKRFCILNNLNYNSFKTVKSVNFQSANGQKILKKLNNDGYVTVDYYNKCTELFNMKGV